MAIGVRSTSGNNSGSSTASSLTITKPTGVVAGDFLLAVISQAANGTQTSGWLHAPDSSWTELGGQEYYGSNGTYLQGGCFWKIATGSESASYAFTANSATGAMAGFIVAYSGVDTTRPINFWNVADGAEAAGVNTWKSSSITPTINNCRIVQAIATGWDKSFPVTATSYTSQGYSEAGSNAAHASAGVLDLAQTTAASTGQVTFTESDTGNLYVTWTLALAPSGTAPTSGVRPRGVPTTNAVGGGSTNITLNTPSGVAAGDVLLAFMGNNGAATGMTAPTGWSVVNPTSVNTGGSGTDNVTAFCFYKVAGSSEPASYTFTSSSGDFLEGMLIAYAGVDNTSPINASGAVTPAASTTATSGSITTTVANCMIVQGLLTQAAREMKVGSGVTWYVEGGFDANSLGQSGLIADQLQAATGATATCSFIMDTAYKQTIYTVALAPASSPSPTPTPAPGFNIRVTSFIFFS